MSKKTIRILVDWDHFKSGDIIEEDIGIALTMIEHGRAVEWKGKNTKLIKNKPHNKKIEQLNNK